MSAAAVREYLLMLRVLIVDDSPADLKELTALLIRRGYEVLQASDAESGLLAAREQQPDLVLMDIVLPGTNGFQATRQLSQAMETRHIPVVLVSNKDQAVDRIWGERQGAKGYVTKPVREAELFAAIGQALR